MNKEKKQVIVWEGVEEGYWDEEWGCYNLVKIVEEGPNLLYIFKNENGDEVVMTVEDYKGGN